MGLNKNSEVNPTEPGSHKPYMDRSLFGCLAGHYNAIGTEVDHFHLNKLEFNSCCSLDNYSSRSHFHQDMMEGVKGRGILFGWNPLWYSVSDNTHTVWSWLVIQLGDTSYDGEHRSYNRVVEMFTSSTTDATKERISK
ncbi:hypothetical protein DPMN_022080 [Dreissena polymorpha]|uniref:Uncharacterized protein n=1 Tax=Dreissena polymorpha TaxID=45954 RepID=A0A9D4S9S5_DREPO|nr:hypothetical protein DPMN_022080 [Dreissena polymorpha]